MLSLIRSSQYGFVYFVPYRSIFLVTVHLPLNNKMSFLLCVVVLQDRVKNFYTRLSFQKLTGISIRNKVPMSDKSISSG